MRRSRGSNDRGGGHRGLGVRRRLSRLAQEHGSASLEFLTVGIILLVPLVYLVLALAAIQAGALGVEGAARQAARVAVLAADPRAGRGCRGGSRRARRARRLQHRCGRGIRHRRMRSRRLPRARRAGERFGARPRPPAACPRLPGAHRRRERADRGERDADGVPIRWGRGDDGDPRPGIARTTTRGGSTMLLTIFYCFLGLSIVLRRRVGDDPVPSNASASSPSRTGGRFPRPRLGAARLGADRRRQPVDPARG